MFGFLRRKFRGSLGVVAYACHPSYQEAQIGGSQSRLGIKRDPVSKVTNAKRGW
jgi:hypothetical protein